MTWTALVPLKAKGGRKSRLAERLSEQQRAALSQAMFDHVMDVLSHHPAIASVVVLADARPAGWDGDWITDRGRGLNAELEAARTGIGADRLMVLHADLPLLHSTDVDALIDGAGRSGDAIAPDRHGTGTNALALTNERDFSFCFGSDSFRLHREQAKEIAIVERTGLALDLDMPEDLERACAAGFQLPFS